MDVRLCREGQDNLPLIIGDVMWVFHLAVDKDHECDQARPR